MLWRRSNDARSVKYVAKRKTASSLSSRWMRWGGITILLFVIWHLVNFTIGKVNVQGGATNDPYNLVVDTFDTWWMTIIYLVAMLALGMHLHHGVWLNMAHRDATSGLPERFFAAGEEKTNLALPAPYGYRYERGDHWVPATRMPSQGMGTVACQSLSRPSSTG